ncbi:MAG: hypothetical protein V5A29_20190 [Haloarculaceae archaeon]
MEDPRPDLKADDDERESLPDFDALLPPDALVRGERTRDDFFDAVLGLHDPATAAEVADRAGHGVDAAREYLAWFERMGIVTRVTDSPATYERNQAYLNWRRVQRLREQYDEDDLLEFLKTAAERDDSFAETFGVDAPDDVAITAYAADVDRSVESVWEDVSMWKTIRRRIALLERALRSGANDTADQRPVA